MNRKIVSLVTTVVLLTSASASVVMAEPLSQQQLQQHKSDYTSAQQKVQNLENAIQKLDSQIEGKLQQIEGSKKKVEGIKKDIVTAENTIKKVEKDMQEEQQLYDGRIRTMYINGIGGYIDVILGAKDLGDLFSRIEAVRKISKLDKKIVTELQTKQEEVKTNKEKLVKQKDQLTTLVAQQEKEMDKLKNDKTQQEKLIAQAKSQSDLYATVLKNDENVLNQTKTMIQNMGNKVASSSKRLSRGNGNLASGSASSVVSYAYNFMGTPYVWGANGPNSFDCSGFTKYVFARFGVNLPRTSGSQAGVGQAVSRQNLRAGDLVFFGTSRIHHVGIYVGNGCYIHAPRTGDVVKVSRLSGNSEYATARRVMK